MIFTSPMRVEPLSLSIRYSDVFFQVCPSGDLKQSAKFLHSVVENDLSSSIGIVQAMSERDRSYYAWVLSLIVHERTHIMQYLCTTLGGHLVRRSWQLAANVPTILASYAERQRFFYRLENNLDPFLCEHFDIKPDLTFAQLLEVFDHSNIFSDRSNATWLDTFIESTGQAMSALPGEIEIRKSRLRRGYLSGIQVLELWAMSTQLQFISTFFSKDYDHLVKQLIEPTTRKWAGEFCDFLEEETGIDFFSTTVRQRALLNCGFFFSLNTSFGKNGQNSAEFEDCGLRFFFAIRLLNGREDILPGAFFRLLLQQGMSLFSDPFEAQSEDLARDMKFSQMIAQTYITEAHGATFRTSKHLLGFEMFSLRRKDCCVDIYTDSLLFDGSRFLGYLIHEVRAPLLLECNSNLGEEAMKTLLPNWHEMTQNWLHFSPAEVKVSDEWSVSATYWNRVMSPNQNLYPNDMLKSCTGDHSPFDITVSLLEPLIFVLLSEFSSASLLKFDRHRIRALFDQLGEGISITEFKGVFEASYFAFFDERVGKCDFCGDDLPIGNGVYTPNDGVSVINSIHGDSFPPMIFLQDGYSYVHEHCLSKMRSQLSP